MSKRIADRARIGRIVLTGMMTLVWTGGLHALAAESAKGKLPPTLAEKIERSFAAIEAASREQPRDTFDPQAILEIAGRDPGQLFDWVRQNTRYVPYAGELRGPIGVLMDRTGNSLDRSLLLTTLFSAAGYEARLACGTLTEGQARQLVTDAKPPAEAAAEKVDEQATIQAYADQFKLDADKIRQAIAGGRLEADHLAEDAASRVNQQAPVLAAALGDGVAEPVKPETTHWWAEVKQDSGWAAFDLGAAAAGQTLTKSEKTVAPDKIPADLKHQVTVKLVVEQWAAGKLSEKTVIEQPIAAAEAIGVPVTLVNTPLKWPTKFSAQSDGDLDAAVKKAMAQQDEWLPVLVIGNRQVSHASVRTDGSINDNPKPDPAGQMGGSVGGAFGGLMGGGGESAGEATAWTAEWIDYQIQTPGHDTRTIRRQVFDLIGPAARASGVNQKPGGKDEERRLATGLQLSGKVDILIQANQISPDFVQQQLLDRTLASKQLILDLARETAAKTDPQQNAAPASATSSGDLLDLAMARHDWSNARADSYFNQINILSYHEQMQQKPDGSLAACEGFDIVANEMGVREGADARQVRLRQGVLDTTAEALLIGNCGRVHNTSDLFTASPTSWKTVRSADDAAIQSLPADAQARMKQDLAAGYVVVAPATLPTDRAACWWRIDPKTGQTLGIGAMGWGQSSTETTLHYTRVTLNVLDTMLCLLSTATAKMPQGAKAAAVFVCMAKGMLKNTKLLISAPAKVGTGLVIDMMTDILTAVVAPGAKAILNR
ncbi:MAG: transglutaminase domain-containing protein [Tepidisphaeraceae bacterium]